MLLLLICIEVASLYCAIQKRISDPVINRRKALYMRKGNVHGPKFMYLNQLLSLKCINEDGLDNTYQQQH